MAASFVPHVKSSSAGRKRQVAGKNRSAGRITCCCRNFAEVAVTLRVLAATSPKLRQPPTGRSTPVAEAEQIFTAVYEAHHRQVYAYAVARVGRDLADEVVADTFLVAWRRYGSLPRGEPLPWLLAVARNVVRERYRAEVRQQAVAAEMRAWIGDAVADVADGVTERAAVLAALARLSEDDRELLTLVAWHG